MAKKHDGFDLWAWLEGELGAPAFEHVKALKDDTAALAAYLEEQLPPFSLATAQRELGLDL